MIVGIVTETPSGYFVLPPLSTVTFPCGFTPWMLNFHASSSYSAVSAALGRAGGRRRRARLVLAEERDAHAAGVEALRVAADDRHAEVAAAALPGAAEAVDEEVVGDVAPAEGAGVELVDAGEDPGGL